MFFFCIFFGCLILIKKIFYVFPYIPEIPEIYSDKEVIIAGNHENPRMFKKQGGKMRKIILFVIAVIFIAGGAASAQEIAKVNGTVITEKEFKNYIDTMPPQYRTQAKNPEVKQGVVENLVVTELLMQKAKKDKLFEDSGIKKKVKKRSREIEKDVDSAIAMLETHAESTKEENGELDAEELEKRIKIFNKQKKDADEIAKKEIVTQEMLEKRKFKNIKVSEKEIKNQYERYKSYTKKQSSETEIPAYEEIKDEIKHSLAKQKWIQGLLAEADVTVDEDFVSGK